MASPLEDVYCTLLMSDSYLPGATVLAHSLRDAGTTKKLAVLVTLDTLSPDTITELKSLYDYLIPVDRIRNPSPANLYLMGRPDLSFAFTKIALWRQTQFRKIIYIDADVVALRAMDELFDLDVPFAAAPDVGWPDAFNSGFMVLNPDMGDYWALHTLASTGDSFDGADQGLLNQYYENRNWHRLSFTYNTTPNAQYQWEPAYRYYKRNISAVHFIGKDKPWYRRTGSSGPGVYNELLARWWAVHDRHFKAADSPKPSRVDREPSGRSSSETAQKHVEGEKTSTESNQGSTESNQTSAESNPPPSQENPHVPEIVIESAPTAEQPLSDPEEVAEIVDRKPVEPTPAVQQPTFSAPQMDWDATKFEPPTESKPEAANFPSEVYQFSESHNLFQPPQSYPEPPKDMWYEVPQEKPAPERPPPAIFPWERIPDRPKPTRVFAEDMPPQPSPVLQPAAPVPIHPFSTVHYEEQAAAAAAGVASPERTTSPKTADEQWQEFQQSSVNAWDNVPSIETYVRAIMGAQTRRNKPQALTPTGSTSDISSPSLGREGRRESLIITDFPSAVERPSLPVTPAPVRRPTFWGEERDEEGDLPVAEGVPDQAEWNPEEKLEQLRRSSVIEFEHLKAPVHAQAPLRELPEHSMPDAVQSSQVTGNDGAADGKSKEIIKAKKSAAKGNPLFTEPDFSQDGASAIKSKAEEVISPTAT